MANRKRKKGSLVTELLEKLASAERLIETLYRENRRLASYQRQTEAQADELMAKLDTAARRADAFYAGLYDDARLN